VKLLLQALITNEPGNFLKAVPLVISATNIFFVLNRKGRLICCEAFTYVTNSPSQILIKLWLKTVAIMIGFMVSSFQPADALCILNLAFSIPNVHSAIL
jgi:ubiquinone/menaquinone biosynthesis C-methylase UbiE